MSQELTFYPLTTSQQMMFFSLKYSYIKSVVNICTMMHFEDEIDEKLLLQAISTAAIRNQAFSLRLREFKEKNAAGKNKKVIKQYFSRQAPEQITVEDFSDSTEDEMAQTIDSWSKTEFPNKSMDTQLYRVCLICKPDGNYAIYFCISHVISDAYSLMMVAKDILNVYVALRDGKAMPKPLPSPLPAYEADWNYSNSEQKLKDYEFWDKEVYATEPHYTSINGLGDTKNFIKGKQYGVNFRLWQIKADFVNLMIPKELVARIIAYATEERVSPQVLYLLAVRNFLSRENGEQEDVLFYNTIARRATLNQKRAGGTMVQAIAFRTQFSNNTHFAEACKIMQQLQTKYYRHANIAITEVTDMYTAKFKMPSGLAPVGYHTVSITFQPYFVAAEPTMPVHFTRHSNGAATMPLYISIMAVDNSGDLLCNYEYLIKQVTPERINMFHSYMLEMLDKALLNPQLSMKELM